VRLGKNQPSIGDKTHERKGDMNIIDPQGLSRPKGEGKVGRRVWRDTRDKGDGKAVLVRKFMVLFSCVCKLG
jgi:hypothetical protein